jgi:hypothetical protein
VVRALVAIVIGVVVSGLVTAAWWRMWHWFGHELGE